MNKWDFIKILLSVALGATIAFFSSWFFQNRLFKKQEKDKKDILRSYLESLKKEIADEYKRMHELHINIHASYPTEYFDGTIKRVIMGEIVKTPIFHKNKSVFDRVNMLINQFTVLNNEIALVQDFIAGKIGSAQDNAFKLNKARHQAADTMGQITNTITMGANDKLLLLELIDEVIKKV